MGNLIQYIASNTIQDNVYNVTFSVFNNQISPTATQLISDFGEPTVSIGGTYTPSSPTPAFTLPITIYRIVSDLPFTYSFDPSNPLLSATYIKQQALYFQTQTASALDAAVTALAANTDTFTGQTIYNFPS